MNQQFCKQNWATLTLGQQIQSLEVEGYLVLPDLLDADQVARLKSETAQLETTAVDYSVHQRGCLAPPSLPPQCDEQTRKYPCTAAAPGYHLVGDRAVACTSKDAWYKCPAEVSKNRPASEGGRGP